MTSTAQERALDAFRRRFRRDPEILVCAPGRVNLIGEHVDYNGGLVLPVAIDRFAWIAAARVEGRTTTIEAVDVNGTVCLAADRLAAKLDVGGALLPSWARYPAAVAWAFGEHGLAVAPVDAALASDVPIGAGLSSSAAVEVAFAKMWHALGGWRASDLELARLCQRAENAYVGVACGLMDPFTSLHGRRGTRAAARLPELRVEACLPADGHGDRDLRHPGTPRARRLGVQSSPPAVRASRGDLAPHAARCAHASRRVARRARAAAERGLAAPLPTCPTRRRGNRAGRASDPRRRARGCGRARTGDDRGTPKWTRSLRGELPRARRARRIGRANRRLLRSPSDRERGSAAAR